MDRRVFLCSVLTAMSAGTLSTMSLANPTDSIGELIQNFEADPIMSTILRYQDLVMYSRKVTIRDQNYQTDRAALRDLSQRVDALIGYTLDHFSDGPCTSTDVQNYLNARTSEALTVDKLGRMSQGLIPIAVTRQVLGRDRISVRLPDMPNYNKLIAIYRDRII